MCEEMEALKRNETWELIPHTPDQNVLNCKWVYHLKQNDKGEVYKFKACLVANSMCQIDVDDVQETFAPVIKQSTIRLVLSIAISNRWSLRQLDVSNAFLHRRLDEELYMLQPPGFHDDDHPEYVCRLKKSL